MNEIEKMYKNANVEKEVIKGCYDYYSKLGIDIWKENDCKGGNCGTCKKDKSIKRYPPFTAEKQIELIKFLLKNYEGVDINKKINRFNFLVDNATFIGCHHNDKSFEESLAGVINKLWSDMSEEEKQQIKEILE